MYTIALNLLSLCIIIAVHEYGHYYFARKYGIIAKNFSIGIGPELLQLTNGEGTRFSLRGIPLGGYVSFPGEEKSFEALTKWQRIKIYFGGPLANLILCIAAAVMLGALGELPEEVQNLHWFIMIIAAVLGTIIIFIGFIPFTAFILYKIVSNPISEMNNVSGPIGIISGQATQQNTSDSSLTGPFGEIFVFIWIISLCVGTFNLLPLHALDGGKIFEEIFSKFKKTMLAWKVGTGVVLIGLILYMIITDVVKLFR